MRWLSLLPPKKALAAAVALVVLGGGVAGFIIAWSGVYSVAASRGHWPITTMLLDFGLRNSIETHSMGLSAPPLDDPELVRLGAGHFASGCAICHGAPGHPRSAVFDRMLPTPPSLTEAASHWQPHELFWIVKHGLKFTGMPAWPTQKRDDEVWAVVAFLSGLPQMTPEAYQDIANIDMEVRTRAAPNSPESALPHSCVRCHGGPASGPVSKLIPTLHGQLAEYLERSLREYRTGARPSGIMQHFVSELSDRSIADAASYYAKLSSPSGQVVPEAGAPEQISRGRRIAEAGIPQAGIPPCLACHEAPGQTVFPRLSGQNARYISSQLLLWQTGLRQQTAPGQIMAVIASRLSQDMIGDVSAFFAARPAAEPGR